MSSSGPPRKATSRRRLLRQLRARQLPAVAARPWSRRRSLSAPGHIKEKPIKFCRGEGGGAGKGGPLWSPVVLFPVLTCGGNAITPHHRATIKDSAGE